LNARALIFVETHTEKKALPIWAEKIGIRLDRLGFSIIPIYAKATGSYHFPVWIGAAEQMGVPYYFILNKSAAERGKAIKIFREKLLPKRNLFLFRKASIEEYFPDDEIMEALEKVYDVKITENERTLQSPKAKSIEKLIVMNGKNPASWNILIADMIAGSMSNDQIDDEIKNILVRIKEDYAEKLTHQ
jgi:predicted ATP-dependent endonuclease of OLD family